MRRSAFVLPFLLLPAFAQEAKDLWIQDFAKAKEQAKAEKKDLLIDFTGSDWCSWCVKLDKEVFSQSAFTGASPKDFILVKLDYPNDESLVTPEVKKQNEELRKLYSIRGYPTILLTDADGLVYGQTGYEAGGPEKYVAMLADLKKKGAAFQAAMVRAAGKQGMERATALDEALSSIDAEVVKGHHLAAMEEIVKLDADGKGKLKDKYEARVKEIAEEKELETEAQSLQEMIGPFMQNGEGDKALTELDKVIAAPKSKIQHQLALFFKGMVTMDVKSDAPAAIKTLEEAKGLLPNSPVAKRIEQILPELKKQADNDKGGEKKEEGK